MSKGLSEVFYWNISIILLIIIAGGFWLQMNNRSDVSVSGKAIVDYGANCLCQIDTSCDRYAKQVHAQDCYDICKTKKGFSPDDWYVVDGVVCPDLP